MASMTVAQSHKILGERIDALSANLDRMDARLTEHEKKCDVRTKDLHAKIDALAEVVNRGIGMAKVLAGIFVVGVGALATFLA